MSYCPAVPDEESGNWSEDDEMFVFRKVIDRLNRSDEMKK